jgi:hypothetical protein
MLNEGSLFPFSTLSHDSLPYLLPQPVAGDAGMFIKR